MRHWFKTFILNYCEILVQRGATLTSNSAMRRRPIQKTWKIIWAELLQIKIKKMSSATRRPLNSVQISTKNTIKLKWQLSQECCKKWPLHSETCAFCQLSSCNEESWQDDQSVSPWTLIPNVADDLSRRRPANDTWITPKQPPERPRSNENSAFPHVRPWRARRANSERKVKEMKAKEKQRSLR